jgi:CheY-like chemotaxis protein
MTGPPKSAIPPDYPHRRPGRVLVIDDQDGARTAIIRNLKVAGFSVREASSGPEGLAILRSDPSVCLVLLDLVMSGMDGWQFREQQLRDERTASVPTVVLTASALELIEHERLQAADYLLKPVGREHLISVVANYCELGNGTGANTR